MYDDNIVTPDGGCFFFFFESSVFGSKVFSVPHPVDALQIVVPHVGMPEVRQVPDRAVRPAERLHRFAVLGERRPGGRDKPVHVGRRDLQVQHARERLVDVQPVVGRRGSAVCPAVPQPPLLGVRRHGRPASRERSRLGPADAQ